MRGQDTQSTGGRDWQPEGGLRRPGPAHRAFGESADPEAYVPRDATEQALLELERCVLDGAGPAVLMAPPGMGKSTLLRVLAERLAEWLRPVRLPYGAVSPEELCSWILGLLGAPNEGDDPAGALRSHARELRGAGRSLLVLIDDADSLPLETARMVGAWVEETEGDICPVLAACDGERIEGVLAAVDHGFRRVRLQEPMNAGETRLYVDYQLERTGVTGELRERFDTATYEWIFRLSRGVPRLVGELALRVIDPHLGDFEAEWSAEVLAGEGEGDPPAEEQSQI